MSEPEQILQLLVGKPQDLEHLVAGQPFAKLQYLLAGLAEQISGCLCHERQVSRPG